MCRLFAFLGSGPERLDRYLTGPAPSLRSLAGAHDHGWGVARFDGGRPHVTRGVTSAASDPILRKAVDGDRAAACLAHIRKATVGGVSEANTHPFRYGPWAFAHNGTIPGAARYRDNLLAMLPPELRANVQGETDSELAFHRILADLIARHDTVDVPVPTAAASVARVFRAFRREHEGPRELAMNFLLQRESGFVATRRNRTLHALLGEGEMGAYTAVASEPLGTGVTGWWEVPEGHLAVVTEPGRVEIRALI